jgi:hypothetical protein
MEASHCITRLEATGTVLLALCGGVTQLEAAWRPEPARWSLLEIICHLVDEEREDFRRRLDLILHHPTEEWPPIDPEGWVTARRYAEQDFAGTIAAFEEERRRSLDWLRGLGTIDFDTLHVHPRFGSMSAGDMMSAWMAHDILHIRQMNRWRWDQMNAAVAPYSVEYAGKW